MTQTSFNGSKKLKADLVKEVGWHEEQDHIRQLRYGHAESTRDDFRGCAVGCTIRSLNEIRGHHDRCGNHFAFEKIGLNYAMARLDEMIFEALPPSIARGWPRRFLEAMPVGADLTNFFKDLTVNVLADAGYDKEVICAVLNNEVATGVRDSSLLQELGASLITANNDPAITIIKLCALVGFNADNLANAVEKELKSYESI